MKCFWASSAQDCTHVAFMPPLRENCALPFWFGSIKVLQDMHQKDKATSGQCVRFLLCVTCFLLLWQFACFALWLQVLALYALLLVGVASSSFVSTVSRLFVCSALLGSVLRFGDPWFLRSPFFTLALMSSSRHFLENRVLFILLPMAALALHRCVANEVRLPQLSWNQTK
eukprot:g10934.t1